MRNDAELWIFCLRYADGNVSLFKDWQRQFAGVCTVHALPLGCPFKPLGRG